MKLHHLYTQRIDEFQLKLQKVKNKLLVTSMLRLTVFILLFLWIYFQWNNWQLILWGTVAGLVVFFSLVAKHTELQSKRDYLQALLAINQTEIEVLKGRYQHLNTGETYTPKEHEFCQDIDLFGKNSFFQYLNRCYLKSGEKRLAEMFLENSIDNIESKQQAIAELSEKLEFRQNFSAYAQLSTQEQTKDAVSVENNLEALKKHTRFTGKNSALFAKIYAAFSLGVLLLYFLKFLPFSGVLLVFFIGVSITGLYVKKVNRLSEKVSQLQKTFRQYYRLIQLVEKENFETEILQHLQKQLNTTTQKASEILKSFSKTINALDQRNNLLFGFIGNGFLLWDIQQSAKLEQWLTQHLADAEIWIATLYGIDAYNALGNFAYNHPRYTFPKISDNSTQIQAKEAVHPLIPEDRAITNDFQISAEEFFIITGANMAGKSTFLRTVSLQIVMSNMGLPIRAASCTYSPIKLITSMRTSDSLAEESSYFYSELSRLKYIIDRLKKDQYFIVLDEILKGTNSKDKALGSQKFLEKLIRLRSTGIIATHDLSLCEVAEKSPQITNYFFDAQIIQDELFFDYKLKKGICQNMNASFLLRKMEIVD